MTRFIGEPSGLRFLEGQGAKVESLARRPAPVVAAGAGTTLNSGQFTRTTFLSIASATRTQLTFDSVVSTFDPGAAWTVNTGFGQMNSTLGALGLVQVCVRFATNATGYRKVEIDQSGGVVASNVVLSAESHILSTSGYVGDSTGADITFGVYVTQTSGGALNCFLDFCYATVVSIR